MFPCPPLLPGLLLDRPWALSLKLSRALKLLDTAILLLVSLAESTLELPNNRPHLLPRAFVVGADEGPLDGEGLGDGEGNIARTLESSVSVNFAGN